MDLLIWTNADLLSIGSLRKDHSNSNRNIKLLIHENAIENVACEMTTILSIEIWVHKSVDVTLSSHMLPFIAVCVAFCAPLLWRLISVLVTVHNVRWFLEGDAFFSHVSGIEKTFASANISIMPCFNATFVWTRLKASQLINTAFCNIV